MEGPRQPSASRWALRGLPLAAWGLCAVPLALCATPFVAQDIPEGPAWAVHVDAERLRGSATGKLILSELEQDPSRSQLDAFEQRAQFDPRTDLDGVTVYGLDDTEQGSLVILDGNIDRSHLESMVKAHKDHRSVEHAGSTLHRWTTPSSAGVQKSYGAAMGASKVAVGPSLALMLASLELLSGKGDSFADDELLAGLETGAGVFLVAVADIRAVQISGPQAAMLQMVHTAQLVLGEQGDKVVGDLRLQTSSPESAKRVQALLQGLLAVTMLSQRDKPEWVDLSRAMTVTTTGSQVKVAIKMAPEIAVRHLGKQIRRQVRKLSESTSAAR